jgi:hypothetical protein
MSLVATLTRIDTGGGDLDGPQTPHAGGIPSLVQRWGVIDGGDPVFRGPPAGVLVARLDPAVGQ